MVTGAPEVTAGLSPRMIGNSLITKCPNRTCLGAASALSSSEEPAFRHPRTRIVPFVLVVAVADEWDDDDRDFVDLVVFDVPLLLLLFLFLLLEVSCFLLVVAVLVDSLPDGDVTTAGWLMPTIEVRRALISVFFLEGLC